MVLPDDNGTILTALSQHPYRARFYSEINLVKGFLLPAEQLGSRAVAGIADLMALEVLLGKVFYLLPAECALY